MTTLILGIVGFVIGIVLFVLFTNDTIYSLGVGIGSAALALISCMAIICSISTLHEYKVFKESFEEQRLVYEVMNTADETNKLLIMTDILEANKQLSEYKAEKRVYKEFTMIPESVFEIPAIGMPVG
jgi:hypothetical protein